MRKPIVAGNWKMNNTLRESVALAEGVKALVGEVTAVDVVICPTYLSLHAVAETVKGSNVAVGAQDAYVKAAGAYTGEVSPQMILDAGATWTIIGHSERRHILGETDALLNEKCRFALESGLSVMFCIGELLEERKAGQMHDVLRRQLEEGLKNLPVALLHRLVIAYEPVWAIGTGETATPEQAEEAHVFTRQVLAGMFGQEAADVMRIQYGGSVKPDNAAELFAKDNVDGFLVGGASLKADSFAAIVKAAC